MLREPLTRIVPETPLDRSRRGQLKGYLQIAIERKQAFEAPGRGRGLNTLLNDRSRNRLSDFRAKHPEDAALPYVGVTRDAKGAYQIPDVPNPDAPDGSWDPYQYAPNFFYDAFEDSFPVKPAFDGDTDLHDDPQHYAHGEVGGLQPLQMGFSVCKKGEYYVLQYASYYADNKVGCDYHDGDSSIASIYLKRGPDGRLKPAYLYTSWHNGGIMTPWQDAPKDPSGHPDVLVGRGSHSVIPMTHHLTPKADGGLIAWGNGSLSKRGASRTFENRLTFVAAQGNVRQAELLNTRTPLGLYAVQEYFSNNPDLINPVSPALFKEDAGRSKAEK